jgi:hypothetical protein
MCVVLFMTPLPRRVVARCSCYALELRTVAPAMAPRPGINGLHCSPIAALPRRPHSDHWPTKNLLLLRPQEQNSRVHMFLRGDPISLLQMAVLGSHYRNDWVLEFVWVSLFFLSRRARSGGLFYRVTRVGRDLFSNTLILTCPASIPVIGTFSQSSSHSYGNYPSSGRSSAYRTSVLYVAFVLPCSCSTVQAIY